MSSRAVRRGAHLRPSARRLLRSKARGVALQHYLDLRHQLRIRWIINCACCPGGGPGSLRLSILVARGHNLEGGVLHTCFVKKNSGAWRPDQYMHACCVEPTPAFVRGPYVENSSKQFQSRSTLKLFARVLHIGTSDERGGWFYATSVHILVGSPGARILFDKTGVENPTLQIVSSCHQNTEPKGARATPRATSAVYNPAYS